MSEKTEIIPDDNTNSPETVSETGRSPFDTTVGYVRQVLAKEHGLVDDDDIKKTFGQSVDEIAGGVLKSAHMVSIFSAMGMEMSRDYNPGTIVQDYLHHFKGKLSSSVKLPVLTSGDNISHE